MGKYSLPEPSLHPQVTPQPRGLCSSPGPAWQMFHLTYQSCKGTISPMMLRRVGDLSCIPCASPEGFPEVPVAPDQGIAAWHLGKLSCARRRRRQVNQQVAGREKQQRQEPHVITTAEKRPGEDPKAKAWPG